MTTEELKRANEITDRINYLNGFIKGFENTDATYYRTQSEQKLIFLTDTGNTRWDVTPIGYREFVDDTLDELRERIIHKVRKEIKSLTTELEKL